MKCVLCYITMGLIISLTAQGSTLRIHAGDMVKYKPSEFYSKVCHEPGKVVGRTLGINRQAILTIEASAADVDRGCPVLHYINETEVEVI